MSVESGVIASNEEIKALIQAEKRIKQERYIPARPQRQKARGMR